jgi:hypothetical protein
VDIACVSNRRFSSSSGVTGEGVLPKRAMSCASTRSSVKTSSTAGSRTMSARLLLETEMLESHSTTAGPGLKIGSSSGGGGGFTGVSGGVTPPVEVIGSPHPARSAPAKAAAESHRTLRE